MKIVDDGTTMTETTTFEQATAAASGAAATEQFRSKQRTGTSDVGTGRVDTLVSDLQPRALYAALSAHLVAAGTGDGARRSSAASPAVTLPAPSSDSTWWP
ncbi:hypothetical protein GCM10010377_43640 [Streptomyces viridiviolaceus]|uniref:hypothetical protein n=1 Tax=Streptomyces viridiviolaceus TaxID=68282 RepID=UPI001671D2A6|nr:hypothetical protein GCM10010377_43640 [Streptomyces viridiviolaceus]